MVHPTTLRRTPAASVVLALAGLLAYANIFGGGPFVFDDIPSIVNNPAIRSIVPTLATLGLSQDSDITISGRPVGAWSLALNYALSGLDIRSYRAINLAIHIAAALLLFGVVRRLLRRGGSAAIDVGGSETIALAVATIWAVHPLTVPSVTYVVQRVESLAGFFLLGAIYCFIRSMESRRAARWRVAAAACCLLGVATKEIVAVAPLLVLLVDRTFYAGRFSVALRARWPLYAALTAAWVVLAALVLTGPRARLAGALAEAMGPLDYFRVQVWAVVRYLRLVFWPSDLVFDYGSTVFGATYPSDTVFISGCAALLIVLGVASLWLVARNHPLGVPAVAFFLILGPSSSFVPLPMEMVAEHRMYLPLAMVLVVVLIVAGRWMFDRRRTPTARRAGAALLVVAAAGLGWRTWERNKLFHDEVALWTEDIRHFPGNIRARTNLARALSKRNEYEAALNHYRQALVLRPGDSESLVGVGSILLKQERYGESTEFSRRAVAADPQSAAGWSNLGQALHLLRRTVEAEAPLSRSLEIDPDSPDTNAVMGDVQATLGRFGPAIGHYEKTLAVDLNDTDANLKIALCLDLLGRRAEAIAHLRAAATRRPDNTELLAAIAQLERPK